MPIHNASNPMSDTGYELEQAAEVRCPACGSPAFVYPRELSDDKPVKCAACGAFVSTYGEMKQRCGHE
jgi:DNA-directed RNA polymerase subunit RPC12/RpoP